MSSNSNYNPELVNAFYTELIHEMGYEVNYHLMGAAYMGLSAQVDVYAYMNAQKLEE